MPAPRLLRTALVAAVVTAALGSSAAGALAVDASAATTGTSTGGQGRQSTAERVHVQTVELADDVSRAKVYKAGKDRYEAEIWAEGRQYGALYTQGMAAHAQNNGLHITLHPDGKVTSWVEPAKPRPKAVVNRVLVGAPTLADGRTTAKLYRVAADHYEADLLADGVRFDTLVADGHAAHSEHNGLRVALQPDGRLTSWVDAAG
ncbi:hypothetical protein [Streptomyces caeruleatus]|uniref:Uncharacterized protein n=1 Tax=Streptomyces caeruleatus TaxID=661399 RepID=A0A124IA98_9ACTN|nr:hypothetical protein [Streptomyces caeruleatus]KUO05030.1 hypothetical protein AQJ67_06410 [Streptomyces caeruleatus]